VTPPARPPDRPPLPRQRPSRLVRGWSAVLTAALALYATATFFGWDFPGTTADELPPSVRSSPGGYRSFHFWHSGYNGGK
jgi:hypothetical protein